MVASQQALCLVFTHVSDALILLRGSGDLATSVIHRPYRAGFVILAFPSISQYTYERR
jgi:hypothetical protein